MREKSPMLTVVLIAREPPVGLLMRCFCGVSREEYRLSTNWRVYTPLAS